MDSETFNEIQAQYERALEDRKTEMLRLRIEKKWSIQKIGDHFGVSRERVRQIIGNTFTDVGKWHGPPQKSIREKFFEKFHKGEDNECWNWEGSLTSIGYGKFNYHGKYLIASRLAWELANDTKLKKSELVLHHCDNPKCVNPNHLFIGNRGDNARDRHKKERDGNKWKRLKI